MYSLSKASYVALDSNVFGVSTGIPSYAWVNLSINALTPPLSSGLLNSSSDKNPALWAMSAKSSGL